MLIILPPPARKLSSTSKVDVQASRPIKLNLKAQTTIGSILKQGYSDEPAKKLVPPQHLRSKLIASRCRICRGHNEHEINLALVSGEPVRSIAARSGYSKSSLLRHYHGCVPQSVIMVRQSKKLAEAEFIEAELCQMVRNTKRIMMLAEKAGDQRTALAAIRELRGLYEVMSRPAVQSTAAAQVNILFAPEVLALRETLL